jgi:hypothetical protein
MYVLLVLIWDVWRHFGSVFDTPEQFVLAAVSIPIKIGICEMP